MNIKKQHWNAIFSSTEDQKLGWYEKDVSRTLELLDSIPEWEHSTIFLPGAGTSVLIEELVARGGRLVLNDISDEALKSVKRRIGVCTQDIFWLCQDIAQPIRDTIPDIDIWIDRAVLHFLTDEADVSGYFVNLDTKLKPGGYALFAEFSKNGAPKCAGLVLHRYSLEELSEKLGDQFKLVSHFDHVYINPNGDPRPYIYALYQKC